MLTFVFKPITVYEVFSTLKVQLATSVTVLSGYEEVRGDSL